VSGVLLRVKLLVILTVRDLVQVTGKRKKKKVKKANEAEIWIANNGD